MEKTIMKWLKEKCEQKLEKLLYAISARTNMSLFFDDICKECGVEEFSEYCGITSQIGNGVGTLFIELPSCPHPIRTGYTIKDGEVCHMGWYMVSDEEYTNLSDAVVSALSGVGEGPVIFHG